MTILDPDRMEDLAACEAQYWASLRFTLRRVFDVDPTVAEDFRRSLAEAPPLQRALALHDHPLDVAAALTGKVLTSDRMARYDGLISTFEGEGIPATGHSAVLERPGEILSSARRDERAPMVTVTRLNRFMGELGYHRLAIVAGAAYFTLDRKALKRPLPKRLDMETLPGLTADREEVYGLDRVLNVLNGLQEFARRKKPTSSIMSRIEKMKERLIRRS